MRNHHRSARINVKAVIILASVVLILGGGAAIGYKVRKNILAARELAAGRVAIAQQDWPEACKQLHRYLNRYPDKRPEVLLEYAEANMAVRPLESQNLAAAISAYRRWLRNNPGDDEVCEKLVSLYMRVGDFQEASYICEQRLEADNTDTDAIVSWARARINLDKADEAKAKLEGLIEDPPQQADLDLVVDAYLLLSDIALRNRPEPDFEAARNRLDQAVELHPQSAKALVYRARVFTLLADRGGDPEEVDSFEQSAVRDLEAAENLQTTEVNVLSLMFTLWMKRGDWDHARVQLEALEQLDENTLAEQEIDPDDFRLFRYASAANLAIRERDVDRGMELADEALDQLKDRRRTAFLPTATELYLAADRTEEARACLKEYQTSMEGNALRDESSRDSIAILRAELILKEETGNAFDAITILREIVTASPENARAWKLLGNAYEQTDQKLRAIRAWEEYLSRAGNRAEGETLQKLVNAYLPIVPERARRYASVWERLEPENVEASLVRIAAELRTLGDRPAEEIRRDALVEELNQMREAHPKSASVRIGQARIALAGDDTEAAISILEQAVKECDDQVTPALQLVALRGSLQQWDQALELARETVQLAPDQLGPRLSLARIQEASGDADGARQTLETALSELPDSVAKAAELRYIQYLMRSGAREEGLQRLRQFAETNYRHVQARLLLLRSEEVQSNPTEAQQIVDELRAIEGNAGLLWPVEQARLWLDGRQWRAHQQEIVDLLTRVMDAGDGGPEPVLLLGDFHVRLGDYESAERVYRAAIRSTPIYVPVVTALLQFLEQRGEFAEAREVLEGLPKETLALVPHRIEVSSRLGHYDDALSVLQESTLTDPQDPQTQVTMARLIYSRDQDAEKAFALLEAAEKASPDLFSPISTRAWILIRENRLDEALSVLNRAVEDRKDFLSFHQRAVFYQQTDQHELAEKDFRQLTAFDDRAGDGHLLLATFYIGQNRMDEALAALEAGFKTDPEHPATPRLLAAALLDSTSKDQQQRGRALMEELLQQWPNDAGLLLMQAQILLRDGEGGAADHARATLESLVKKDSRNALAHLLLINIAQQAGDLNRADELATRALGANPDDPRILLVKAEIEARRKNTDAARQLALQVAAMTPPSPDRKLIARQPWHLNARLILASLALDAGDLEEAGEQLRDAESLAAETDNPRLLFLKAQLAYLRRDTDTARELARKLVEEDPQHSRGCLMLFRLALDAGNTQEAETWIAQAETAAPNDLSVFQGRMRLLALQGHFDAMDARLAELPVKGTEAIPYLVATAEVLMSTGVQGQPEKAAGLMRRVVDGAPDDPDNHALLGKTLLKMGDAEGAEQAYRRTLELDPHHETALNDLAWVLGITLGKPQDAVVLANEGVLRYPENPHLLDTRAALLIRLDRFEDARQDLERCLGLDVIHDLPSTHVSALRQLADIHVKQGKPDLARQRWTEVLEIDRQHQVLSDEDRTKIARQLKTVGNASAK